MRGGGGLLLVVSTCPRESIAKFNTPERPKSTMTYNMINISLRTLGSLSQRKKNAQISKFMYFNVRSTTDGHIRANHSTIIYHT